MDYRDIAKAATAESYPQEAFLKEGESSPEEEFKRERERMLEERLDAIQEKIQKRENMGMERPHAAEPAPKEVPHQMVGLQKNLMEQREIINNLQERLGPILGYPGPEDDDGGVSHPGTETEIGGHILDSAMQVHYNNDLLRDILSRLAI